MLYGVLHIIEEVGEDAGMRDLVVFCFLMPAEERKGRTNSEAGTEVK